MALREALAKHKIGIFMQCIHVVHISVSWRPAVPMGWGGYGLLGVIVHLLTPLGLCFLGDHWKLSEFCGKGGELEVVQGRDYSEGNGWGGWERRGGLTVPHVQVIMATRAVKQPG